MSDAVELPRAEDNIERVVRYSLIGRHDFEHDFGGVRMWAPSDLMIRFRRHTSYRGGQVTERSEWRCSNVELHARLRLKSGQLSDKVDIRVEFEQLPHESVVRGYAEPRPDYRKVDANLFPYVADMIAASTPASGELC